MRMITPCIFRKIDQLQGPKDAHEAEPTTLNRAHSNRPLSPVMLNMQPLLLPWRGQGVVNRCCGGHSRNRLLVLALAGRTTTG